MTALAELVSGRNGPTQRATPDDSPIARFRRGESTRKNLVTQTTTLTSFLGIKNLYGVDVKELVSVFADSPAFIQVNPGRHTRYCVDETRPEVTEIAEWVHNHPRPKKTPVRHDTTVSFTQFLKDNNLAAPKNLGNLYEKIEENSAISKRVKNSRGDYRFFVRPDSPQAGELVRQIKEIQDRASIIERYRDGYIAKPELKEGTMPVNVFMRRHDILTPLLDPQAFLSSIDSKALVEILQGGHSVYRIDSSSSAAEDLTEQIRDQVRAEQQIPATQRYRRNQIDFDELQKRTLSLTKFLRKHHRRIPRPLYDEICQRILRDNPAFTVVRQYGKRFMRVDPVFTNLLAPVLDAPLIHLFSPETRSHRTPEEKTLARVHLLRVPSGRGSYRAISEAEARVQLKASAYHYFRDVKGLDHTHVEKLISAMLSSEQPYLTGEKGFFISFAQFHGFNLRVMQKKYADFEKKQEAWARQQQQANEVTVNTPSATVFEQTAAYRTERDTAMRVAAATLDKLPPSWQWVIEQRYRLGYDYGMIAAGDPWGRSVATLKQHVTRALNRIDPKRQKMSGGRPHYLNRRGIVSEIATIVQQ